MIDSGFERGLVAEPGERRYQREQLRAVKLGPRDARVLGADEEPGTGGAHGNAASMERGLGAPDGRCHQLCHAMVLGCARDAVT
ncbi:hypothetical protein LY13_005063 [Prauserella aidingensis]|nr:hypothetical protein [Prauserella aidingensis]